MVIVSIVVFDDCFIVFVFFFFKQKTAYELRISDWSSDVCSSDLVDRTWNADPCDQCRAYSGGSAATSCCCPGAKPDSLLSALRDGTSDPHWRCSLRSPTACDRAFPARKGETMERRRPALTAHRQ